MYTKTTQQCHARNPQWDQNHPYFTNPLKFRHYYYYYYYYRKCSNVHLHQCDGCFHGHGCESVTVKKTCSKYGLNRNYILFNFTIQQPWCSTLLLFQLLLFDVKNKLLFKFHPCAHFVDFYTTFDVNWVTHFTTELNQILVKRQVEEFTSTEDDVIVKKSRVNH